MYQFLLKNKHENNINKKLKYWIQIWNELIDNFNKGSYGLKFENPHTIIKELLEEIEYNHLKNTINKEFFKNRLGIYLKKDIVINKNYNLEIKNLIDNLNSDKNEYIYIICSSIDKKIFNSKCYIKLILSKLKEIIVDNNSEDYESIQYLTTSLIIEFVILKYDLSYIKKMIKNIFSRYIDYSGYVITDLPIDSKLKDEELKKYIENITIEERIQLLGKYIDRKEEELYIICKLEGFKAIKELECGDVELYNPKYKNHIKSIMDSNDKVEISKYENWYDNDIRKTPNYYNAIVKVYAKDDNYAFYEAVRKIELVFNTIRCCYTSKYSFSICKDSFYVLDKNKNFNGSSSSVPDDFDGYSTYRQEDESFIANNEYLQNILEKFSKFMYKDINKYNETQRKIIASLRAFRKGNESKQNEDKLLNYWICIENLMNIKVDKNKKIIIDKGEESVFRLAQEIIPSFYMKHYLYESFRELYVYLYNLCYIDPINKASILEYSQEILHKFNLERHTQSIDLSFFVENLQELENNTEEEFAKEKIYELNKLLNINKDSIKIINTMKEEIKGNILEIYRYRNMIVHDAHINESFLGYYVNLSEKYARCLMIYVIEAYCNEEGKLMDLLLSQYSDFKVLLINLKEKNNKTLKDYILNNEL